MANVLRTLRISGDGTLNFGWLVLATCVSAGFMPAGWAVLAAKTFKSIKKSPFEVSCSGYS
jgi:hypothetical protein